MPADCLLQIDDLHVARAGKPVLRGIHWQIRRGEFWWLLGANGSGKTTLMHTLLGLLPSQRGRLSWCDEKNNDHIGFVGQDDSFTPIFACSVEEFAGFGFAGLPLSRSERRNRLDQALQQTGLQHCRWLPVQQLSGGQRQRARIARALVRQAPLLLLDEPTAHLDPHGSESLFADLARLNRDAGQTIICVSHDLQRTGLPGSYCATLCNGTLHVNQEPAHVG